MRKFSADWIDMDCQGEWIDKDKIALDDFEIL